MQYRNRANTDGVTNIAQGSTVGIQAKEVTGSVVTIGATPPLSSTTDLAAELAAVRTELARARSRGTLDTVTYVAAQDELDLAAKALAENTPDGKSRFVLALKRLRGLIVEAADVATKVAALITAVNGVS